MLSAGGTWPDDLGPSSSGETWYDESDSPLVTTWPDGLGPSSATAWSGGADPSPLDAGPVSGTVDPANVGDEVAVER